MTEDSLQRQIDKFILDEIDSVPHLEALLLLWNSKPRPWTPEEIARALFVSDDAARKILLDLARVSLAAPGTANAYFYASGDRDQLIEGVEKTYRREIVRISRMIHSKPSASVREFAKAFEFKRDKD
jgi:hypothetical protein